MTTQQAINELATGNRSDEAIKTVAQAVAANSQRGEWYDGSDSTNVIEWVTQGDFDGSETVATLAAEWDK